MKKLFLAAALLAGASLCLQDVSIGHGGTYRGPGDTVPPGGGGGGGGGGGPAGPGGPTGPGGAGPTTPGSAGPITGSPATGGPGQGTNRSGPTTGNQAAIGPDLTLWSFWWEFNKDPYLNLKAHIYLEDTTTGDGDFFLGQGERKEERDSLRPNEKQIREKIVPALLRALENETNNDIVTGCMVALAKIGDISSEGGRSEFEQVFKKFLADGNQEISESAALALGILANDASVPILTDLLLDTAPGRKWVGKNEVEFRRRSFAAYGLALIGNRTASEDIRRQIVSTLSNVLESVQSSTHDIKVACLIGLGLVRLETLGDALLVEDGDGSPLAPDVSREAQIAFVKRYFQDDDNHYLVRAHAPASLARLLEGLPPDRLEKHKLEIAQILLERLSKRSKEKSEVIQSCVLALGMLGDCDEDKIDAEIRKVLVDVVEDTSDAQAKHFSRIALGQVGGKRGTTGNPDEGRSQVTDALSKTLSRGNNFVRQWSGLGMGVMGRMIAENSDVPPPVLASALRQELQSAKNPEDVGAYSIAVGILRDVESRKILLEKLEMSQDEPRGYAAVALGLMNAREAVQPITNIVLESKYRPDLLKQAAIALGLLGDKTLVPRLLEMLVDAKSLATQASISTALGFIGDARSVEPLIEMLQNDQLTSRARGFAAVALGIVADKETVPWNSKIAVNINYRASTHTLNDAEGGTGVLNIL